VVVVVTRGRLEDAGQDPTHVVESPYVGISKNFSSDICKQSTQIVEGLIVRCLNEIAKIPAMKR
jgi:hypothetical protein